MSIRSRALYLSLLPALVVSCGRVPAGASGAPASPDGAAAQAPATPQPDAQPQAGEASPAPAPAAAPAAVTVDFEAQVRPILRSRCSPCHFEGGKMYADLPFDQPATIRELGQRLFTRIKDDKEQAILRAFFSQSPPVDPPAAPGP